MMITVKIKTESLIILCTKENELQSFLVCTIINGTPCIKEYNITTVFEQNRKGWLSIFH